MEFRVEERDISANPFVECQGRPLSTPTVYWLWLAEDHHRVYIHHVLYWNSRIKVKLSPLKYGVFPFVIVYFEKDEHVSKSTCQMPSYILFRWRIYFRRCCSYFFVSIWLIYFFHFQKIYRSQNSSDLLPWCRNRTCVVRNVADSSLNSTPLFLLLVPTTLYWTGSLSRWV